MEKVYLMILDGFGEGKDYAGNAIKKAKMPNFTALLKKYPSTVLQASGNAVGLPKNKMGNSEVGHFTIGSGRITWQTLEEINRSITNKSFFPKKTLLNAIEKVKKSNQAALHLIGMIPDAGVHSHLNHLFALLELVKKHKIWPVYIHAITDGRDVQEKSAIKFLNQIETKKKKLKMNQLIPNSTLQIKQAQIATIIGRFYPMDRDHNLERTQKAYNLYIHDQGIPETNYTEAIKNAYKRGAKTDYYIDPIILNKNGIIKNKDVVIFWNFRTDRPRQLTEMFVSKKNHPYFVCFGNYSKKAEIVFPPPIIKNNLSSIISNHNLNQLRLAETEKYAHVTYFFNSQIEKPLKNETRILIKSKKIKSYADAPGMSARGITQQAINEIKKNKYSLIVQNFANPDLVGHSGNLASTIKACEVIDECIGKITNEALNNNYHLIITADHGNAEYMLYKNNEPCPSHTKNPVKCLLISKKIYNLKKGGLQDIAPTILKIMNIAKPKEMRGKSLI